MEKWTYWLEHKLASPMTKLSEQRHLRAIRDGVISALPFIIIGSFFLILAFPPVPEQTWIAQWAQQHRSEILIPYRLTMFIMSLYISCGIGYHLAKSYRLHPLAGAQLAIAGLLLTIVPTIINGNTFVLPMVNLGGHGLFVAILVSIIAVEILRICQTHRLTITMPKQVPTSVARSFEALIPVAILIGLMTLFTVILKLDLHAIVSYAVTPFVRAGDSLLGVLVPVFLITFFWSFGIHGVSVVGTIVRPVWEVYLAKNAEAVAAGHPIPYISPETFYQWFIWIGGSGATIGLAFAMLFCAKSKVSKTLGRTTIIPSLFNINEPIIFGAPIVLNPILIIPFIICPILTATLSYIVTYIGWVHPTYIMVPWTLPAPIGAYLATGGDWRAIILVLTNILISFLIYLPFFKMHDRKLHRLEKNNQTNF
ncbi:PTS system, cellobiose-specific IIC component [Seinonella peptonophila]|uniref:Permease IIC component n=1 Tax=Seinonella peptonophila TaxID=112248 RepID=A0A1M4TD39_9BACL|nr:PTS sugar transporter subunit IIC [Seinonella peptonophila]SHE42187.1 PTS system, cellobiose-specific IIC component [Seinonella peptonophila]